MRKRHTSGFRGLGAHLGVLGVAGVAQVAAAFPPPTTADPAAELTAAVSRDDQSVQSFSRTLFFDPSNPFTLHPRLYWFKYTSDGAARVKFDTLGSDFGTNGPGGGTTGGTVLGSYNQSQIAVYRADGTAVAVSKGTVGPDGQPRTLYPNYSNDASRWYYAQGLSEVYFEANAPRNPRWDVSPSDPNPHTSWAAPGNEGNGQKYYQPHYPTNLNEYQVWNTALSPVILDASGQPVINPATDQPRPQPGWRYYDRARVGPGSSWNRFEALPAGDYYIAISSPQPTFAGDFYAEEILRAPIHYDSSTNQVNQRILTQPMSGFQYYLAPSFQEYYGTIQLNVTTTPLIDPQWQVNADGVWSQQANWDGSIPSVPGAVARFAGAITTGRTVTLDGPRTVGTLAFDNDAAYTIAGSDTLTLADYPMIRVARGDHTISAPLAFVSPLEILIDRATDQLTIANLQPSTQPIGKLGAGRVVVSQIEAHALRIQAGEVAISSVNDAGIVYSLQISPAGTLDLGLAALVVNYGAPPFVASPLDSLITALVEGRIDTSASGRAVGYAEASELGLTSFLNRPTIDSTAVLLRSTLPGDANLDGSVGFDDLLALAQNYGMPGRWTQGDSNYDATISFDDLLALAQNYGAAVLIDGTIRVDPDRSASFTSDWSMARSVIPEPSVVGAMTALALGVMRRRS
jgi:hypothetical protein